jgi:predicted nuclease of restriction endonuclease-like RecB superfamily
MLNKMQRDDPDQKQKKSYPLPIKRRGRKSASKVDASKINAASRAEMPDFDIDTARVDAAYQEELGKWQGQIEAAACDPSLSKEQRLAAVFALRQRQLLSAQGVRQRVLEEEIATAKAARRAKCILLGLPVPEL